MNHITEEQFESLGFYKLTSPKVFYKIIDNNHVIPGHDTTEVYIKQTYSLLEIELKYNNSHESRKQIAFRGRCNNIEFLKQILEAII